MTELLAEKEKLQLIENQSMLMQKVSVECACDVVN